MLAYAEEVKCWRTPEERVESPGVGVTGDFELPNMDNGIRLMSFTRTACALSIEPFV